MTAAASADRRAELAWALEQVRARIGRACDASHRPAGSVTLVAVTKARPASDVAALAALGVRDVGENRVDQARAKHAAVGDAVTWHFLGRIQSRQTGAIARVADVVHSVDRPVIATRLGRAAVEAGRRLLVFVQLSFDADPERGGAAASDLPALADHVAMTPGLELAGVMAVPVLGADPWATYRELAGVAGRLQEQHPGARFVSAGMSDDLEAAVAAGATHLRVGAALLGVRRPPGDKVRPGRRADEPA